jgi:N-ethylmaleimide reductase
MKLFESFALGSTPLQNRMVMAPLTRSRAIGNVPNDLMVIYYAQRATAGLIITEGTSPSPNGLGYPRIPGIFSPEQVAGWKKVTDAVHAKGGKIFIQLMHTGRVSHPDNLPVGAEAVAPSAVPLSGEMYTDTKGMQAYPTARAMTLADIEQAQQEYVQASKNAIAAGFDGVEFHGANGYLIEQFINPAANERTDTNGGSLENRARFAIEVAQKVADAIGADRTGMRLSPYGAFNDMKPFADIEEAYRYLATELGKIGLVYLHTVDHSSMGAPAVPAEIKTIIGEAFGGTIIASGGFDKAHAEQALQEDKAELVAFGRPFLANPDLVHRLQHDLELNDPDYTTFYTPGEKGYTDYPVAKPATSTH